MWLEEADKCENTGNIETSRAIYNYLIEYFKNRKNVWMKAIEFEQRHLLQLSRLDSEKENNQ